MLSVGVLVTLCWTSAHTHTTDAESASVYWKGERKGERGRKDENSAGDHRNINEEEEEDQRKKRKRKKGTAALGPTVLVFSGEEWTSSQEGMSGDKMRPINESAVVWVSAWAHVHSHDSNILDSVWASVQCAPEGRRKRRRQQQQVNQQQ